MLSDEASMLTGSLGLLPSASLGAKNKDGEMRAMSVSYTHLTLPTNREV